MRMVNRRFNMIIMGMACCMGALALCGMFFMLGFYTHQMQNMVGIVYEYDEAAAEGLLQGMFSDEDRAALGMEAAWSLGYTKGAFWLWSSRKVFRWIAVYVVVVAAAVCGTVCLIMGKAGRESSFATENEHMLRLLHKNIEAKEQYYADREQGMQVFMENVAHQLKTPLAAVMVNLELMEGEDRLHDERLKDKCIKNMEKMRELLMLLLNTARISAGKLHFNKERLDVAELVDRLKDEDGRLAVESVEGCVIDADSEWMYQALKNIVVNGLLYGRVVLRMAAESDMVRIEVIDEGPGVAASDASQMFDRYYVGGDGRKDSTGIGLNLSYMVVKAHGGDIIVHNLEDGGGCMMEVRLPRYNMKEKAKISEAVRVL